jgi:predicted porin
MKKQLTALAVASLCGAASAQSSVTVYGVADAAVESVKGATTVTRLASGQQQGSRWGVRGVEDLGGGLSAQFLLEAGINLDTGTLAQGGRGFGRQSYVGLGGGFGALRLGRQYSPMDDIASIVGTKVYDVLSVVPVIGNGDYNRVDNAITYLSPNFGGLTLQLQHSLGAERLSTDASADFQQQTSAHAMYVSGPLTLGLGLQRVADADGTAAGDQPINAVLLAGTYSFGALKLTGYYDSEDRGVDKMKVLGAALGYTWGNTTASVGLARARDVGGAGAADDDATLLTLQGSHNLSKRTALYAHYTGVSNGNDAALGFNSPVAGQHSSGIQLGIRHRF